MPEQQGMALATLGSEENCTAAEIKKNSKNNRTGRTSLQ
jgi:hypothetical protein